MFQPKLQSPWSKDQNGLEIWKFHPLIDGWPKIHLVNLDFDWFWPKWPFCPSELIDPLPFKIDNQSFKHMIFQTYRVHVQSSTSKFSRKLDEIPNPSFGQHRRRLMNHLLNFKSSGHLDQFLVQGLFKYQRYVVASKSRFVRWPIALIKQNPNFYWWIRKVIPLIIKHKLQSSDDPKRWIKCLEICKNLSLKDPEV